MPYKIYDITYKDPMKTGRKNPRKKIPPVWTIVPVGQLVNRVSQLIGQSLNKIPTNIVKNG